MVPVIIILLLESVCNFTDFLSLLRAWGEDNQDQLVEYLSSFPYFKFALRFHEDGNPVINHSWLEFIDLAIAHNIEDAISYRAILDLSRTPQAAPPLENLRVISVAGNQFARFVHDIFRVHLFRGELRDPQVNDLAEIIATTSFGTLRRWLTHLSSILATNPQNPLYRDSLGSYDRDTCPRKFHRGHIWKFATMCLENLRDCSCPLCRVDLLYYFVRSGINSWETWDEDE